jgi:hypothetical protein
MIGMYAGSTESAHSVEKENHFGYCNCDYNLTEYMSHSHPNTEMQHLISEIYIVKSNRTQSYIWQELELILCTMWESHPISEQFKNHCTKLPEYK